MLFETLPVSPFQSNCYVLGCEETRKGLILDPGDEAARIAQRVEWMGLTIVGVAATHGHIDHITGAADTLKRFPVPFYLHPDDFFLAREVGQRGLVWGMPPAESPPLDHPIKDGDEIVFGNQKVKVIHTPGHSPGSVCFLWNDLLFTGDTLFAGSVGRTDFEGGDMDQLLESIQRGILTLPDTVRVLPGHGPASTVAHERRSNPFLNGSSAF